MQEKPDTAPPAPVVDDSKPRQVSNFPFPAAFLRLKTVGVWFKFRVGEHAINNFRMIGTSVFGCGSAFRPYGPHSPERHFFQGKLIKSFDFNFGYCIANSVNTHEDIYDVPQASEQDIAEMVAHPGETKSDNFYFVDGKLVIHTRAQYTYKA